MKPKRTKATFYFHADVLESFNKLYATLILNGQKKTKTSLLEEALNLLKEKYQEEWLATKE